MLSDRERRAASELEAALLSDEEFARTVRQVPLPRRSSSPPVVVGVGPDGGLEVVEWAAAEAAAQRCPLRVVHAVRPPVVLDPLCMVPLTGADPDQAVAARRVELAVDRARAVAPELAVSGGTVQGGVPRVLVRESRGARLLVLGGELAGRPRSPALRLVQGAIRRRVVASAGCPVAVVHPPGNRSEGATSPRVVVGVDGTPRCDGAVGFAFRAARQRGIGVTAVHAWTADCPADLEAFSAPLPLTEAAARALAERAVARWRREYPDVPVRTEVVHRDPADALIAGSAGAGLLVVGSRARGGPLGAMFGSVSRAVLDGAAGPVAVVRHVSRATARDL